MLHTASRRSQLRQIARDAGADSDVAELSEADEYKEVRGVNPPSSRFARSNEERTSVGLSADVFERIRRQIEGIDARRVDNPYRTIDRLVASAISSNTEAECTVDEILVVHLDGSDTITVDTIMVNYVLYPKEV